MSPLIKALLSALVIALAICAWIFRDTIGLDASPILLFGLTIIMTLALWLFPEVKKDSRGR
jgi:hypothetical protein